MRNFEAVLGSKGSHKFKTGIVSAVGHRRNMLRSWHTFISSPHPPSSLVHVCGLKPTWVEKRCTDQSVVKDGRQFSVKDSKAPPVIEPHSVPQLAQGEITGRQEGKQGCFIRRIHIIRRIVFNTYFTLLNVPNDRMTHPWRQAKG